MSALEHINVGKLVEIINRNIRQMIGKPPSNPVESYRVVCDETNNDPASLAKGELCVDITLQPTTTWIKVPLVITNADGSQVTQKQLDDLNADIKADGIQGFITANKERVCTPES